MRWRVMVAAKKDQIQRSAESWLFPTKVLNVVLIYERLEVFSFWTRKTVLKMACGCSNLNIIMI